ncbi:hypothetical protein Mapa_009152 [Marchantia paleacea]|nr:hypothetical protein Mapa_009152 [Marchantia paleacea]
MSYVWSCFICQQNKIINKKKTSCLLQPLSTSSRRWEYQRPISPQNVVGGVHALLFCHVGHVNWVPDMVRCVCGSFLSHFASYG